MGAMDTIKNVPLGYKIVLAGVGGQGVLFATRLLAQAAIRQGLSVMASETHGMSQRGGSVLAHLRIEGTEAALIGKGTADMLLALEASEGLRNLAFVRPKGSIFINSDDRMQPDVHKLLEDREISLDLIPASKIAQELGSVTVANVVLIGCAAGHESFPLKPEAIEAVLDDIAKGGRGLNKRALQAGYKLAEERMPISIDSPNAAS